MTERRTRKPTGLPSWPILLIAGAEKAGKSYSCAEASGSDLIGATYWIGIGEDDPDEYGAVPGARFEIVQHDGTYRDILAAIDWANTQPVVDGKPNLIVIDSATRLWDLLCDMAQAAAVERAKAKAKKYNKPLPDPDDARIGMDLWNQAKDRWGHVMDALRAHAGPVLVTARLDEVSVLDGRGEPTGEKTLKVKAEKSLPYDVGAIVQMPSRGDAWLTGVRSVRVKFPERKKLPKFTVDALWRDMGLADATVGVRSHQDVNPVEAPAVQAAPEPPLSDAEKARRALIRAIYDAAGPAWPQVQADWAAAHNGQPIKEATDIGALELLRDDLSAQAEKRGAA